MSLFEWKPRQASMVWLEPHRVHAGGRTKAVGAFPEEDALAMALAAVPAGPTKWVVDDLWAPALLVKDVIELPPSGEARDAFFQWRYSQHLAVEEPQTVQARSIGDEAWLLLGMSSALREGWLQMATKLGRPIHALIPRWLWLYNRLAPSLTLPGLLLSLSEDDNGEFTGTLAAWNQTLTLLRQWREPASAEAWMQERVNPTAAFLQRESRPVNELIVWGARSWPAGSLPARMLPRDIPAQEAL